MRFLFAISVATSSVFWSSHQETPLDNAEVVETHALAGRVVWSDVAPEPLPPLPFDVVLQRGCCQASDRMDLGDRRLRIGAAGGLRDAVVTLEPLDGRVQAPAEPKEVELLVRHCRFEPHVAVLHPNDTLVFFNGDDCNHNIHTYGRRNPAINRSLAPQQRAALQLIRAESIQVSDDLRPWMGSRVVVAGEPFASVSDETGAFAWAELPAGAYRLRVQHPRIEPVDKRIRIGAGEPVSIEVKVRAKP